MHINAFDPYFPFDDFVFLPDKPMTDVEFAEFAKPQDREISIELVDFDDIGSAIL